jgi:hypothetical protein
MTATAEVFHATYPDGPQDAESLVLTSDGRCIVTKGEKGSVALYRFPRELHAGSPMPLQRVAKPRDPGKSPNSERITDATRHHKATGSCCAPIVRRPSIT